MHIQSSSHFSPSSALLSPQFATSALHSPAPHSGPEEAIQTPTVTQPAVPIQRSKSTSLSNSRTRFIDAFNKHVDVDLIEHGPYDPQGRDAVAAKLAPIFSNGNYEILRWNYDNNYGTVMLKVYLPTGEELALIDLFRMEGTCIVEHWDISQVKQADATNPIAMF